jgi:hypothetical protein
MPEPNQNKIKIICVLSNGSKINSTTKILETSDCFKTMLEVNPPNKGDLIELPSVNSVIFPTIHSAMKLISKQKNSSIRALYEKKDISFLTNLLIETNKLDITSLQKELTAIIAQKCDALHFTSPEEQQKTLIKIKPQFAEEQLFKDIVSYMGTLTPTLTPQKLTTENCGPIENNANCEFSPNKKVKCHKKKNVNIITLCNSDKVIYSNQEKDYYFNHRWLFAPQDKYALCLDKEVNSPDTLTYNCILINLNDPNEQHTIGSVICSCFNPSGTLLLIDTFDLADNSKMTKRAYNLINTSTGKSEKSIPYDDNIDRVFFYDTNKLFVQNTKSINDKSYSIQLRNITNDNITTIDNIQTHNFNETKNILVYCVNNTEGTTITIHNTKTNENNEIPLNELLTDISIVFNKNNDSFLIKGTTKHNEAQKVILYDSQKKKFDTLFSEDNLNIYDPKWSPTGNYIISTLYKNEGKQEIQFFNINKKTQHTIPDRSIIMELNPQHDIAYLFCSRTKTLTIHNISTQESILCCSDLVFNEGRLGNSIPPSYSLSNDNKLLILYSNAKAELFNATTGAIIKSWLQSQHKEKNLGDTYSYKIYNSPNVYFNKNKVIVQNNTPTDFCVKDILDVDYNHILNIKDNTNKKYPYIAGFCSIALIIAAYVYYPEFFKKLILHSQNILINKSFSNCLSTT